MLGNSWEDGVKLPLYLFIYLFFLIKQLKVRLCAIFLCVFRVLHPAGGGTANSVRALEGIGGFICMHLHPINTSNLLT